MWPACDCSRSPADSTDEQVYAGWCGTARKRQSDFMRCTAAGAGDQLRVPQREGCGCIPSSTVTAPARQGHPDLFQHAGKARAAAGELDGGGFAAGAALPGLAPRGCRRQVLVHGGRRRRRRESSGTTTSPLHMRHLDLMDLAGDVPAPRTTRRRCHGQASAAFPASSAWTDPRSTPRSSRGRWKTSAAMRNGRHETPTCCTAASRRCAAGSRNRSTTRESRW